MSYVVRIASDADIIHAPTLVHWYIESSKERKIGIAKRSASYLSKKMAKGDAVIALNGSQLIGFCYIESFENKKYVSNSGLIINKSFRGQGISSSIKKMVFSLALSKYPDSRIFGITTSDIVMGINTKLGYRPVSFSNLTSDDTFWSGCSSCPNYDILIKNKKKMCLCTGMLALSKNELEKQKLNNQNE